MMNRDCFRQSKSQARWTSVALPMRTRAQRSLRGRWKLVLLGCLGFQLLAMAACCAYAWMALAKIRSSWPYTEGLDLALHNEAVVEELGEPIQTGWRIDAIVHDREPAGDARLLIPLVGAKNAGTLSVSAVKEDGRWRLERAEILVLGRAEKIFCEPL